MKKVLYTLSSLNSGVAAILLTLGLPLAAFSQAGSYESHDHPKEFLIESIENGVSKLKTPTGQDVVYRELVTLGVPQLLSMGKGSAVRGTQNKSAECPTFNLIYKDRLVGSGKGFDDPSFGAQRAEVLEAAFAYISNMIQNSGSADIMIDVSNGTIPSNYTGQFAVSKPVYTVSNGYNQNHVMKHILTGTDPNVSNPDGTIEFNFNPSLNYFYEYPSEPGGNQFDFYTICLHEICHLLGFTSNIAATGVSEATTAPQMFSSYDQFLRTQDGNPLLNGSSVSPTSNLISNSITFDLQNGDFAPVYSPSTFSGSSLDHFDNTRSNGQPFLMNPGLSRGQTVHYLSHEEAMVMQILGYTIDVGVATSVNDEFSSQYTDNPVVGELYPNPSSKDKPVKINISNVKERDILVVVYDILGRQAYSKVIVNEGMEGGTYTAVDPSHNLAAGMYIVVGSTKDELFNKKLIIR